jgi:acyl-CoA hydrolase
MSRAQAATLLSPAAFVAGLPPGLRLFVAGCAGQPDAVLDALAARPDALRGATFVQVPIPGVNRRDLSALAPLEALFMTPELREGLAAGRVRYRPLHYSAAFDFLRDSARCDMALFRCSAPRQGRVSLGLAHDFVPALQQAGAALVGVVDPGLPFVPDGVEIGCDRLYALVDGPSPSPTLPSDRVSAALAALGRHAAGLIRDGDTLQAGIGAAVGAVLGALHDHRALTLHGGMVTDASVALLEAGVVLRATTGVALGSAALYARVAELPQLCFRPVSHTHDPAVLAALPRLVAVNGAVEVDLLGQVNAEMVEGRQISGHGGLADFVRGARRSAGGRAVTVLAATGRGGSLSRIVPRLEGGTPVAITRADIDFVVTEHGVAALRDADIDERAERLIGIAAPAFRAPLADAWRATRPAL